MSSIEISEQALPDELPWISTGLGVLSEERLVIVRRGLNKDHECLR